MVGGLMYPISVAQHLRDHEILKVKGLGVLDSRYLLESNNLSDLTNVAVARTNLGLVAGGAGDIWVEKAGDTMVGTLQITLASDSNALQLRSNQIGGRVGILYVDDNGDALAKLDAHNSDDPSCDQNHWGIYTKDADKVTWKRRFDIDTLTDTPVAGFNNISMLQVTDAYLRLKEDDDNYIDINRKTGGGMAIRDYNEAVAQIDIDPMPGDGTSAGTFRFFRSTSTTGSVYFAVYIGDGTNTVQSLFNSKGNTYLNINKGNVGINVSSPQAQLHVKARTAATVGLIVQGAASQSGNLQEWQSSAGAILSHVNADGSFHFGDATNNLQISAGGILSLAGTAKRALTLRADIDYVPVIALSKPTQVTIGVFRGFSMPIWNSGINADEQLFFNENVPGRWDGESNIIFHVLVALASAETAGEKFKFQLSWNHTGIDHVLSVTTHDTTDEITVVDGTQYAVYLLEFTLDYDVDPEDPVLFHDDLVARLRRVESSGDEVDGEIIVLDWHTQYQVDKMFKAL